MKRLLKLEGLENDVLREILCHLSSKDKVKLLLCCKRWNRVLLPLLWENMTPSYSYYYRKQMYTSFRKYGHYIKYLDLKTFVNLPIHSSVYPNCNKLYLSLDNYLKNKIHFESSQLTGLYYTNFIDDMKTEDYILKNKICIEKIFQNLKYFKIHNLSIYFKISIIPLLPSNLSSLVITDSYDSRVPYFEFMINKFDNLKVLKLINIELGFRDFICFLNKSFPELDRLHMEDIIVEDLEDLEQMCINLNNYPKLMTLYYQGSYMLLFNGTSNLKELVLSAVSLENTAINKEKFPKLNQLTLNYCVDISSKQFYLIFNMSTITYLNLLMYNHLVLLIKEIYPKNNTNIISLKIVNPVLDANFFNFLYTSCPILCNLEIIDCEFKNDISFSDHKIIRYTNLTNIDQFITDSISVSYKLCQAKEGEETGKRPASLLVES
ncbi:hypothetical protein K502DRAFT_365491 [Neoconidiobolus thromboides FSU 785]|nr:hypothetical protein K502DRAFT_365491 [Neoconidiobolus thromboides FSU 785]